MANSYTKKNPHYASYANTLSTPHPTLNSAMAMLFERLILKSKLATLLDLFLDQCLYKTFVLMLQEFPCVAKQYLVCTSLKLPTCICCKYSSIVHIN